MRKLPLFLAAVLTMAAVLLQPAPAGAANNNLVTVTVTGQGTSKTDALRDAQRKAVERAAGTIIYSETKTKDFILARDTILTRAAGFVQEYTVISQTVDEDGVVTLKIRAVVSKKGIVDYWGVVTNLLKQMGRPKIMVFMVEKVDGKVQQSSTLQTQVENRLLKNGFKLVDKAQLKAIHKKDIAAAIAADKPATIQKIAKSFGAQIFITGVAQASSAGTRILAGRRFYSYLADVNVRVYRSDTAELIATQVGSNLDQNRKGVQQAAHSAAVAALTRQANYVVPRLMNQILRKWADILEGRGEVQLKVSAISFGQYVKLKKALKTVKGVNDVTAKYHNKQADISIESDVNAETLAERIVEQMEDVLEIDDVTQNVIKGKYIKKK